MPDNFNFNAFSAVNPPWSLPQLDANFSTISTALTKRAVCVTDPAFGAVGNGVTNDYAAFMLALATNRPVFVPAGIYVIGSPLVLTVGQALIGEGLCERTTFGIDQTILKFTNCDGIGFSPQDIEDGDIVLANLMVRHSSTAGTNTNKGVNLTACNKALFYNVRSEYFQTGFYLQRGAGAQGCYYNKLAFCRMRYCKYGIVIDDSVTGTSVNNNMFINPHYVDNGTWANGIAFQVSGYGHSFYSPHASGFTGAAAEFMRFSEGSAPGQSVCGDVSVYSPYIESSPAYGFRIPTTTSGRTGIVIGPGQHFDGPCSIANYSDPQGDMTILPAQRGTVTFGAAATRTVTLPVAMPDALYRVAFSGSANETFWVTNKTTTTFVLNSSNAASVAVMDWTATR